MFVQDNEDGTAAGVAPAENALKIVKKETERPTNGMRFDEQNPRPGDMWAANFFRSYHAQEFVQWTRTSRTSMRPDQLGRLVFQ